MKTFRNRMLLLLLFILPLPVYAAEYIAVDRVIGFYKSAVHFSLSNSESSEQKTDFSTQEAIKLDFIIDVAPEDVGLDNDVYLVAVYNGELYMHSQSVWQTWDGQAESLQPTFHKTLVHQEIIQVLDSEQLPVGEYQVYAAYNNHRGDIYYNGEAAAFRVTESVAAN